MIVSRKLTSAGHKDLNGHILEQVTSAKDGSDLIEVPLAMEVVHIGQHLQVYIYI